MDDVDGNLDALFAPETVAVIGASRDAEKIGHSVMRNLVEAFDGRVVPVNPNADTVLERTAVDAVTDIDDHVDLAVVTVPPGVANDVIRDCVDAGVDAVIVITAGYREIGEEGEARAEELQEIVAGSDTRVLGPNCLGIWDAYSGVDTLFLPGYKLSRPPQGDIAILTQSGSFGTAVMDLLAEMDVGVSRFISYGNQADITEVELLEWLCDDEKTAAVAAYMEGVSDGRRFREVADRVTDDMPVITLKAGKDDAGREAVSSHTGSLAGSYRVYQGVLRQSGVYEAPTMEALFDASRALAYNPPLAGDGIAVVTNGGGFGVLAADALNRHGLSLAGFSDDTRQQLRELVPSYGTVANPLDLIGDATPDEMEQALRVVGADDNVHGIVAIPLLQPVPMDSDVVDALISVDEAIDVPLVTCLAGGDYTRLHAENLEQQEIAAYSSPDRAARGMDALRFYGDR